MGIMQRVGEFDFKLESWQDDKLGVSRVVMSRQWDGEPYRSPVPTPPIAIPLIRAEVQPNDGYGTTYYYFEGIDAGNSLFGTERVVYEFQGSFNQEPITSHPNIGKLLRTYDGTLEDGEVSWAAQDPTRKSQRTGFNVKGQQVQSINPMYGVNSYLAIGAVWSVTRIVQLASIPQSILRGVGTIYNNVPGDPPTPPNRNWLKMSPTSRQRGNCLEVSEYYMLSGIGGWVKAIYDGSDLNGESEG
jgi:hypothetical protein